MSLPDNLQAEVVDEYRRIVVGMLKGHERTAHNAPIQSLVYEDLVKYALRRCLPPELKLVKGEVREGSNGTGDCDIIVYEGEPTYVSRSGTIGIIPRSCARALVEVENQAGDVAGKYKRGIYKRFKEFCPNVYVVAFEGEPLEGYYEKWYDVNVFILADAKLKIHPGELRKLVHAILKL
jgi:hypothetical protein